MRKWPESDPRYAQVEKSFLTMWEVLRKRCYKEDNESVSYSQKIDCIRFFLNVFFTIIFLFLKQITPEEFCQLWHNPDQFEDWEKTYMELTFELQDTSGTFYFPAV